MNAPFALVPSESTPPVQVTQGVLDTLPAMVDRARSALASARTAAEVLEARGAAALAYDLARGAARFGRAMAAHDELVSAAWRVQGDALLIEAQAKIRLADEYDAAQQVGDAPRHGGSRASKIPDGNLARDPGRLSVPLKAMHEARRLRDAAGRQPGLVERTVAERLAASREPTRAAVRDAVAGALSFGSEAELDVFVKRRRAAKQAAKAEKRVERSDKLAERTRAAAAELGRTLYPVLYVDFPWRTETWSDATGMDRVPDNHYPTLSDEEVVAFPLPAGPTAIVYMWATVPKLPVALAAMQAQGFAYKSLWVWGKPDIGLGYHGRENLELLLIGTRGGMMGPLPGDQPPMLQMAPRGRRHSEKPALFADCIAQIYPDLPKIELFARGPRAGWDVWGNEADGAEA